LSPDQISDQRAGVQTCDPPVEP